MTKIVDLHAKKILSDMGDLQEGYIRVIDEVPPEVITRRQRFINNLLEALRGEESAESSEEFSQDDIAGPSKFNSTMIKNEKSLFQLKPAIFSLNRPVEYLQPPKNEESTENWNTFFEGFLDTSKLFSMKPELLSDTKKTIDEDELTLRRPIEPLLDLRKKLDDSSELDNTCPLSNEELNGEKEATHMSAPSQYRRICKADLPRTENLHADELNDERRC